MDISDTERVRVAEASHRLQVPSADPLSDRGGTYSDKVGGLSGEDDLSRRDQLGVTVPVLELVPVLEGLIVLSPFLRHRLAFDLARVERTGQADLLVGQRCCCASDTVSVGPEEGEDLTAGDVKVSGQLVSAHRWSVTLHQMGVAEDAPTAEVMTGVCAGGNANGPVLRIGAILG